MTRRRRDILTHRDAYSLLATALFLGVALLFRRFSVDDAFISFRYARHLGDGLGLVMNPGERVEGISNLPWTVLLGFGSWLGLDPHVAAPFLALLAGVACVGVTAELAARCTGDVRGGGLAALVLALAAPLAVWGVSGLETLAYTLLVTLLLLRALAPHPAAWTLGLLSGAVAVMRPEGLAYTVPVLAHAWLTTRSPRHVLTLVGYVLAVLVPVTGFRILYYGDWIPNPVHAKVSFTAAAVAAGAVYVGKMLVAFPLHACAAVVACAALRRAHAALLLAWILVPTLVAVAAGGERFPAYRLLVPMLPVLAVCAEVWLRAWRRAHMKAPGRVRRRVEVAGWILAVAGLVLLLWPQIALPLGNAVLQLVRTYRDDHAPRLLAEARFLGAALAMAGVAAILARRLGTAAGRVDPVQEGSGKRAALGVVVHESAAARRAMAATMIGWCACTCVPMLLDPSIRPAFRADPAVAHGRPVGRWLRGAFPDTTWVATNAAGSVPYFSGLPAIDMLGLTDAHIARVRPDRRQWPGHERGDGAYVLSRRPDLIILGGAEGSATPWPFAGDQQIAAAPEFGRDYVLERQPIDAFEFVYFRHRHTPPAQ